MPLVEVPQQVALVFHTVAVVLALFQILFGKADVLAQTPAPDCICRGKSLLILLSRKKLGKMDQVC
jgi:hypothetical protein